ncbi:dipeptide/oligopeptide/nickel ABC transporter ATP-binding protein [Streptomyces longisporoflavus]|uniref:ABC transporter ATP-binding protein n=1 Tax=Streptomyces longisporoflavus TaxID=28044 RepID=UPI00167EE6E4|nr:ABC transporter ATP-binding protein [Streptomyces longisporoflavus]GGV58690.1 dipeptide/oligopeptide/nickel ABC transporter ATP-binding protein [Streptomyces longisporoflavus]
MPDIRAASAASEASAASAASAATAEAAARPLLEVSGVTKSFGSGRRRLTALDGVDIRLGRGETLGLVGESGCGKSTLARVLLGLERPDAGTVRFDGTDPFALRGKELLAWRRRVQMVFQDPFASLNARMSAAELIGEPWRTHRDVVPTPKAREKRVRELLALVGLRDSDAHRYPGEFSGGQRQRIGIARALALDPDLIVCDEPVSALDLSVQAQVLNVLSELRERLGVAYVFISHDLSVVRYIADRVTVMYLGKVIEHGDTEEVFDRPQHPYTSALMSAAPVLDASRTTADREIQLQGEIPSPFDIPSGCRFRTRCPHAENLCTTEPPPLATRGTTAASGTHTALCHFPLGVAGESAGM